MATPSLNRKLIREMSRLLGQIATVALVLAGGITCFIALRGTYLSLEHARAAYYERYRFADVFARAERVPESVGAKLQALPTVAFLETRVSEEVTLPLEGMLRPAYGRLLSLPSGREPSTNALYLRTGRLPARGAVDEAVALESFAEAHGLRPVAHVPVVLNGKLRHVRIVGIALSPEFVFAIRPGALADDRYVVSAPTTGRVSRLLLEPGDSVREGDVLAEIAPALSPLLDERTRAEAEARLGAALSALGQARAQAARASVAKDLSVQELTRTKRLADTGSLSQQELEQAEFGARMRSEEQSSGEFARKVASEEVRVARIALGRDLPSSARDRHVDVLAPVSGRVLRVLQKSAGVVQAGAALVEVGDARALEVVVDLLTTDAVQVEPGTAVVIQGWAVRSLWPARFGASSHQRSPAPRRWASTSSASTS